MAIGGQVNRRIADYKQAAALLRDPNLVWSADLDCIREDLARYIESSILTDGFHSPALNRIVQTLISTENDLSV
jgi:hypothetical protein